MAQFKEGEVVRLKSGGPAMTVTFITPDGLQCYWWSATKETFISFVFQDYMLDPSDWDNFKH